MSQTQVFFRRVRINAETGTATIICSDQPITQTQGTLAGLKVATQAQSNITFGVLSLRDPETGSVMGAKHPTIKALQSKLNSGDEMPGFALSSNPVVDRDTGEETGLFWVEAI
tara:strand:+ start:1803 stop:2141 length:339 start_codon:yes stop_codon:yes gene_type:complete